MILCLVNRKKLRFENALIDSWYTTKRLIILIDNMGKINEFFLKINRLVDDTGGVKNIKK